MALSWQAQGKLISAVFFAAVIAVFATTNYGWYFIGTFINGEASIPVWMHVGLFTFTQSFVIAVACSSFDILFWFYGISLLHRARWFADDELLRVAPLWLRPAIKTIAQWVHRLLVPHEVISGARQQQQKTTCVSQWALLFGSGFWPANIWFGITYSFETGIHPSLAFAVIALGNGLKMLVFGKTLAFCINFVTLALGALGIKMSQNFRFVVILALAILGVYYFKKIARWVAIRQSIIPIPAVSAARD